MVFCRIYERESLFLRLGDCFDVAFSEQLEVDSLSHAVYCSCGSLSILTMLPFPTHSLNLHCLALVFIILF